MILEELCVSNFCLFRGRQVIDLRPGGRGGLMRPIVLFGGMNGGGKTTLFDAIQLALYGTRARCSKRAGRSYDDFLRASINSSVPPGIGAGVSLTFRLAVNGEPHSYEVRRDWRVHDGRIKEDLYVAQDGVVDTALTRQWSQLVEELVPIEISQLFFFDGEKIRSLLRTQRAAKPLGRRSARCWVWTSSSASSPTLLSSKRDSPNTRENRGRRTKSGTWNRPGIPPATT
ncbi:AAA family ATPase [Gemmata sp. G18]|uniref:AAA family ATPase n=1 Tax=Gemmata palustris TaxID=2822762 RepID=A0ABS5BMI6_9BACT|nr:AAA family ATPase [Gemmata palustris]